MDRPLVYSNEGLRSKDFLYGIRGALIGLGHASLAAFGPGPCVSGLQIAATGPASLSIIIGTGSIYSQLQVDTSAYGVLGTDADFIDKQGIRTSTTAATPIAITPPVTSGQSQWYLIQAIYNDSDTTPVVLPYWNSSNPDMPLSGPSNSGTPQNTQREGLCQIALKAGVPAATGSQVPPTPDAGYVGLWLILVANGQTTITSADWRMYPNAPFIPNLMSLGNYFQRLVPATTFYVNGSTGNDSNDGSQLFPFATPQGCINAIAPNFSSQTQVTVNLANGTYTHFTIPGSLISSWNFVGNTGSPSSVVIANAGGNAVDCFSCTATLSGMTFTSLNFNVNASGSGANINITNCNLTGSSNTPSVGSFNNAIVSFYGAIGYSGNGNAIAIAEAGGQINMATTTQALTLTLTGTPAFSQSSFVAFYGNITFNNPTAGVTISGSATGTRGAANANGIINTSGVTLPGNASGTTGTGGQII